MQICAFNRLHHYRQLTEVITSGTFLMEMERYNLSAQLFQLHDFYVEVYTLNHSNKVVMIQAFTDETKLEPYLEAVDISELI